METWFFTLQLSGLIVVHIDLEMLWETWLFSTLYFENLEAFKRNWDLSPFSLKDFSDSVDCLLSISTNFACFSWIGYMAYTMHIVARKKNKSLIFSYILPYWKNMSVKMVKLVVRIYKQYMVGWGQHEKELKSGGGGKRMQRINMERWSYCTS